jgi:hypothetical protein
METRPTVPKVEQRRGVDRRAIPRGGRRATDCADEERERRIKQVVEYLNRQKSK